MSLSTQKRKWRRTLKARRSLIRKSVRLRAAGGDAFQLEDATFTELEESLTESEYILWKLEESNKIDHIDVERLTKASEPKI